MNNANLHVTALTFIMRHDAEHLDGADLVKRTTDYLTEQHDISTDTAFNIASQAWAEFDGRGDAEWIDISRTTSRCVLLHMGDGTTVAFTASHLNQAADLLRTNGVTLPNHCPY